jgi:hypothetical protein
VSTTAALALLPDLEAAVGDHLRNHEEIVALGARVAGQLPRSFTTSWVRLTQLDAKNAARSAWALDERLIDHLLQFDCYAGSEASFAQAEASTLARTVRAVLVAMPGQTLDGAVVVTDVLIVSHARIPDLEFKPPRERFAISATVIAHAA